MLRCGILGLPNVGKSTLFNALTGAAIAAENFPFCTIEPNVGVVPLEDSRLHQLAAIVHPEKIVPASVEFVDIAGLVEGASKGEGRGNQFLSHVRDVDALIHVVRCFEDDRIIHVGGKVNPEADIATIHSELILSDLEIAERALSKHLKMAQSGDKEAFFLVAALKEAKACLENGALLRSLSLSPEALSALKPYQFITQKPMLYLANISENKAECEPFVGRVRALAEKDGAEVLVICNQYEAELAPLSFEEKQAFLKEIGESETGLSRLSHAAFRLLGLQTYFTAGKKEVRAWTIRKGASAPEAAGVIHSDFEHGFIRAEVIAFEDYLSSGGETQAKTRGLLRVEGKEYLVQDGDVMHFRFNV